MVEKKDDTGTAVDHRNVDAAVWSYDLHTVQDTV